MTTYHRLLLITALTSAFLTFCLLQINAISSPATVHQQPQQLQSAPQPKVTEYYVMTQPGMMTLAWQPCTSQACQPLHAAYNRKAASQNNDIGI